MKLYKYRDLSEPDEEAYERLSTILRVGSFWCADPASLNDPEEFRWKCNYTPTDATISLLARVLVKYRYKPETDAIAIAATAVREGRLEALAAPVVMEIMNQCRSEIGLACFGRSKESEVMWARYGGGGAGVCVEVEVPSQLLHNELFPVQYSEHKELHIDELLLSALDTSVVGRIYEVALLSKPLAWAPEEEIRFVAKRQKVSVVISGSRISSLVLGPHLTTGAVRKITGIAKLLSYDLPVLEHGA